MCLHVSYTLVFELPIYLRKVTSNVAEEKLHSDVTCDDEKMNEPRRTRQMRSSSCSRTDSIPDIAEPPLRNNSGYKPNTIVAKSL
jgi:hypothetical protein